MKNYRFTRDLDGVAEGEVRSLSPDDVVPLLDAGTIVETDEDPAPAAVVVKEPIEPITAVSMKTNAAPPKAASARRSN